MFCADELSAAVVAKIVSLGPIEVSEKRFKRNLRDNQLNFLSKRRVYTLKRRQLEPRRKFVFLGGIQMAPRRMFVQCRFDTSRCNACRNVDEFRAQLKKITFPH